MLLRNRYRYEHKKYENSKEICHNFIGNILFNRSAANGALITARRKWQLKCEIHKDRIEGHNPWPPGSPDLTPFEFYLCRCMKEQAYQPPIPQPLRERISQGVANADKSQLRRTWEEFEYRVNVCTISNGTNIEDL